MIDHRFDDAHFPVNGAGKNGNTVTSEILDRQPPRSLEAERAVIGSMLLRPAAYDEVAAVVQATDFYDEAHQRLYRHVQAMHKDGQRTDDLQLLHERLKGSRDAEFVGGLQYLTELALSTGISTHALHYARIVRDCSGRRQALRIATELLQDIYAPESRPELFLFDAAERLTELHAGTAGVGSAAALAAAGIRAAEKHDKAAMHFARATGGAVGGDNMAAASERVAGSMGSLTSAFGNAFARSAGIGQVLNQLANVIDRLVPLFEMLGQVVGGIVGVFTMWGPLTTFIVVAFKALTMAIGITAAALLFLAKRWAMGWVIQMLTGMKTGELAWAAAIWVKNAALAVTKGLLIAIGIIGAPLWLVIGTAVLVVAAAIATVVAVGYGLYKLFEWLTSGTTSGAKGADILAKQMERAATSIEDATKAAEDMENSLAEKIELFGLTDAQRDLLKYEEILQRQRIPSEMIRALVQQRKERQAELAVMERQAKVMESIVAAVKASRQFGMTDAQKKRDDRLQAGFSPAQASAMAAAERVSAFFESIAKQREDMEKAADDAKKARAQEFISIAKEIADIEFEAATVGLTAGEKRLAMMEKLSLNAEQMAKAQEAAAALDTANENKRLADLAKHLIDSTATPLEKYRKAAADIQNLLKQGLIGGNVAQNALAAANKDFMQGLGPNSPYRQAESPTAVLRNTAAADLLASRQKQGPLKDPKTVLQENQLAEQRKMAANLDRLIAETQRNRPVPDLVADVN